VRLFVGADGVCVWPGCQKHYKALEVEPGAARGLRSFI